MKVISASRRTDIPAFYPEWFMNRIRAGYVRWRNPFSGTPYTVSLHPEDVSAIVFWSKDNKPLLPHLDELGRLGYRIVFHSTIAGLPKVFEPHVPNLSDLLKTARALAERYGRETVLWRYDPIVSSGATSPEYHLSRFRVIAEGLEGVTTRCHFSFAVFYGKVVRNTARLQAEAGIELRGIALEEQLQIAEALGDIAADHGTDMYSCCGDHLVEGRTSGPTTPVRTAVCTAMPIRTRRQRSVCRRSTIRSRTCSAALPCLAGHDDQPNGLP